MWAEQRRKLHGHFSPSHHFADVNFYAEFPYIEIWIGRIAKGMSIMVFNSVCYRQGTSSKASQRWSHRGNREVSSRTRQAIQRVRSQSEWNPRRFGVLAFWLMFSHFIFSIWALARTSPAKSMPKHKFDCRICCVRWPHRSSPLSMKCWIWCTTSKRNYTRTTVKTSEQIRQSLQTIPAKSQTCANDCIGIICTRFIVCPLTCWWCISFRSSHIPSVLELVF